jgi:hypothetical protein
LGRSTWGDREDRDDVGDRDQPNNSQRLRAGEARLGDHRRDRGGRARSEDHGVDRSVPGAGEPRGGHASERAEQQHSARGDRAAAQRGGQPRFAERDVCADGEHQHREAHVAEELHRGVRQVDRIQTGTPDDDARENLADHHRNEGAAPHAQQRAARPASTINASRPKFTVSTYAARAATRRSEHRCGLVSLTGRCASRDSAYARRPPTLTAASLALHR